MKTKEQLEKKLQKQGFSLVEEVRAVTWGYSFWETPNRRDFRIIQFPLDGLGSSFVYAERKGYNK